MAEFVAEVSEPIHSLHVTTPSSRRRALSEELERIRDVGYALDREEHEEGINCLAIPLFLTSEVVPDGADEHHGGGAATALSELEASVDEAREIIRQHLGEVMAVKITDVEALVLQAVEIDTSRADGTQDAFIVRVHTDEGLVGVGEGDTSPYVAREIVTMPSSHAIARGLQRRADRPGSVADAAPCGTRCSSRSYHYGRDGAALHAMSAIDMALWDLLGQGLVDSRSPICSEARSRRESRSTPAK